MSTHLVAALPVEGEGRAGEAPHPAHEAGGLAHPVVLDTTARDPHLHVWTQNILSVELLMGLREILRIFDNLTTR